MPRIKNKKSRKIYQSFGQNLAMSKNLNMEKIILKTFIRRYCHVNLRLSFLRKSEHIRILIYGYPVGVGILDLIFYQKYIKIDLYFCLKTPQ